MPKLLTKLRIDEISAVDVGAGEGVKIMLVKRDFDAKQRRAAAASGAAMPDGSFPIHNEEDLQNAMRLAGKAKNPAAARRHIKERAESLGLTSALSDKYKSEKPMSAMEKFFAKIFGTDLVSVSSFEGAPANEDVAKATARLASSVNSIVADDGVEDKRGMLAKSFVQYSEYLNDLLSKALPVRSTTKEDDIMSPAVLKALGLDEKASEQDILKALAARDEEVKALKAKKDKEPDGDEEKDDAEGEDKRQKAALPEHIQKALAERDTMMKRLEVLENERELTGFTKQAVELGLPDSEGQTLQKAYKGDKEAITKLASFVKMGIAAAKAGEVFKEFGGSGGGTPATPYDELEAKAAEYRKSHPDLTAEQAFAKVYEDPANREITKRERRENRPVAH